MVTRDFLVKIVEEQKAVIEKKGNSMRRDVYVNIPEIQGFATIISGVRRCGKSTMLQQLLHEKHHDSLHLNFDDSRLFDFTVTDFQKLDAILSETGRKTLMLDEIQVVKGWERYIRQKLEEGFNIYITGSNASLLSKEIGTSLTGRHITTELFPFSYKEFCRFKNYTLNIDSFDEYMRTGGFPDYVKTPINMILSDLLDDILVRDIAIRYGIKDIQALRRLTVFLLSNIGNLTSANKLKEPCGVKSTTTILEYLSHLELAYLISLVPMYDLSIKKQLINPKKIYAIDLGLVNANVSSLKMDNGHKLENLVFCHLRQSYKEIYYHKEKGECDFITINKGAVNQAIQVCYEIDESNEKREFDGLKEAMKRFELTEGLIITHHQEDEFIFPEGRILVLPCYKFI